MMRSRTNPERRANGSQSVRSPKKMQVNGQSGVRAPHMPRKSDEREFLNEREGAAAPDFSWINGILDHLKNGRGNWIRTSDLFVPKEPGEESLNPNDFEGLSSGVSQNWDKIFRELSETFLIFLNLSESACYASATRAPSASKPNGRPD